MKTVRILSLVLVCVALLCFPGNWLAVRPCCAEGPEFSEPIPLYSIPGGSILDIYEWGRHTAFDQYGKWHSVYIAHERNGTNCSMYFVKYMAHGVSRDVDRTEFCFSAGSP